MTETGHPDGCRSTEDLRAAVGDIDYEITTLAQLAMIIRDADHEVLTLEPVVAIACFEAALLHARSLIGFLFPPRADGRDIVVHDFLDDAAWSPISPERELLDLQRSVLHKHLAHLAWQRVGHRAEADGENPDIDVLRITRAIVVCFDAFLCDLAQSDRHPERAAWFEGTMAMVAARLGDAFPEGVERPAFAKGLPIFRHELTTTSSLASTTSSTSVTVVTFGHLPHPNSE